MLVGKKVVPVVTTFGASPSFVLFDILSFLLIKLRLEENRFAHAATLMPLLCRLWHFVKR
jgi:hypothetical protein